MAIPAESSLPYFLDLPDISRLGLEERPPSPDEELIGYFPLTDVIGILAAYLYRIRAKLFLQVTLNGDHRKRNPSCTNPPVIEKLTTATIRYSTSRGGKKKTNFPLQWLEKAAPLFKRQFAITALWHEKTSPTEGCWRLGTLTPSSWEECRAEIGSTQQCRFKPIRKKRIHFPPEQVGFQWSNNWEDVAHYKGEFFWPPETEEHLSANPAAPIQHQTSTTSPPHTPGNERRRAPQEECRARPPLTQQPLPPLFHAHPLPAAQQPTPRHQAPRTPCPVQPAPNACNLTSGQRGPSRPGSGSKRPCTTWSAEGGLSHKTPQREARQDKRGRIDSGALSPSSSVLLLSDSAPTPPPEASALNNTTLPTRPTQTSRLPADTAPFPEAKLRRLLSYFGEDADTRRKFFERERRKYGGKLCTHDLLRWCPCKEGDRG